MTWTKPQSQRAAHAYELVSGLQERFRAGLERTASAHGDNAPLEYVTWLREQGRHGGGGRYVAVETPVFNRAAINVSQVHYDDLPEKKLASATAISTIIHPHAPRAPSVHMHFSFTERRDGTGYWRLMADLNPSLIDAECTRAYRDTFAEAVRGVAGTYFDIGLQQGDAYFHIPALNRTRGVFHFYLEAHTGESFESDLDYTRQVAERSIDTYVDILDTALKEAPPTSEEELREQIDYHTAYLFQVLTLDRGTTSGLLVHNENDVGIMGSLPAYVNSELLRSWVSKVPAPQDQLVQGLVDALERGVKSHVTTEARQKLADTVRRHYTTHQEAVAMQAAGIVAVPTVQNHG